MMNLILSEDSERKQRNDFIKIVEINQKLKFMCIHF